MCARVPHVGRPWRLCLTKQMIQLLLLTLVLFNSSEACYEMEGGVKKGKVVTDYALIEANHQKLVIPLFPNGMGVTLAGVKVEVCGEKKKTGVSLRVQFPNLVAARSGPGRQMSMQIDKYVVPFSLGFPILGNGDLLPPKPF